ncbi:CHAD domain-containing protein [Rossellomorea vietnamensis]|uniref:CHAD domain-containing protein n=1 Tax=Rossellomorea TaxID=2837508 RepID=UPI0016535CE4|nr:MULTISPECIES: CHAD domain-containing protein [Rossellomorea]
MKIISATRIIDDMGRVVFPNNARKALNLEEDYLIMRIDNKKHLINFSSSGRGKKVPIDESGRIPISPEYMNKLGWETGTEIGLFMQGEEGVLQGNAPSCVICGSNQALLLIKKTHVCEDCIHTGTEASVERWSAVLGDLFQEYKEYCEKAVTFTNTEDVHKARTKGRRLRTLIHFIGIKKDHPLYKCLKEAHDVLGKVRENDVFIEAFDKEAENNKYSELYSKFIQKVEEEREEHRNELKQKLPHIIDDEFSVRWTTFSQDELKDSVVKLDIDTALKQYEKKFDERVFKYKEIKDKKSDKGLDALHSVRKQAKKLRYICSFLNEVQSIDYTRKSKQYKKVQKDYGDIIDLRDWIHETRSLSENIQDDSDDVKKVRKQLNQRLKKLVKQVEL